MKILVERNSFEEPKIGNIVQTNIGVCMKICAGYLSLEGDTIGTVYHEDDIKVSEVLIKSEDVVISKAEKDREEIYEVEKVEKIEGNSRIEYKNNEFFISETFIKFIGKLTGDDIKKMFKVDDSSIANCLDDLVYGIYKIYHNHRDKMDDKEFMANELKNMIYNFFDSNEELKRTDTMLFDCIGYFKNLKKEDISEIYYTLLERYHFDSNLLFDSLTEIVYYFNKIGRLVEIGRIEHFFD